MENTPNNDFDSRALDAAMERYRSELLRYQRATPPGKPTLEQSLLQSTAAAVPAARILPTGHERPAEAEPSPDTGEQQTERTEDEAPSFVEAASRTAARRREEPAAQEERLSLPMERPYAAIPKNSLTAEEQLRALAQRARREAIERVASQLRALPPDLTDDALRLFAEISFDFGRALSAAGGEKG